MIHKAGRAIAENLSLNVLRAGTLASHTFRWVNKDDLEHAVLQLPYPRDGKVSL